MNEKQSESAGKMTVSRFQAKKRSGKKISIVTAYDYPSAKVADSAGIDVVLVGDSLGNVVQGRQTTLTVTLEQMIYHAQMVVRAVKNAMVVVDMPFPTCQIGGIQAIEAAAKIIKETEADAVKIEGGQNRIETIRAVVKAGIPVLGHCGFLPQNIRKLGGYKIQRDRQQLVDDVLAIETAGAFGVVLELVPPELAAEVSQTTAIPTIGIGAGGECDGQVLVFHDLLGFSENPPPKHAKQYAKIYEIALAALENYKNDVENGRFA
ncbi:MAG: 3-methyl-2-oxobutanoate hydroxymethyltransferase [Planctomycetaceae bacterium]|jgi:3-methyl-2-oxobutanoate hydroxymethyltransferase|nr:3-methyl-2-oxobutanoate hydroxymethyltransferase [Planctomycetaceae bacterium]